MPADIIDGNAIARQVRDELVPRIEALRQRGIQPGLAVVLVGEHPASVTYVRGKMKDSRRARHHERDVSPASRGLAATRSSTPSSASTPTRPGTA